MVGVLVGARETKVPPAIVIRSATYLTERSDVLVAILTTKVPSPPAQLITFSWTGDLPDSAQNPASGHTC